MLGCQVCSALEKQSVPKSKVFFGAKCASADEILTAAHCCALSHRPNDISVGAGSNLRSKPNQASSGLQIIQN